MFNIIFYVENNEAKPCCTTYVRSDANCYPRVQQSSDIHQSNHVFFPTSRKGINQIENGSYDDNQH